MKRPISGSIRQVGDVRVVEFLRMPDLTNPGMDAIANITVQAYLYRPGQRLTRNENVGSARRGYRPLSGTRSTSVANHKSKRVEASSAHRSAQADTKKGAESLN
jgi:hypothetical protein